MEEFLRSLDVVIADIETENAAMESQLIKEDENSEIMHQSAELQTERVVEVLLDMDIETAKEDLKQAKKIHVELMNKAKKGEEKLTAEKKEKEKFLRFEQPNMERLEKSLAEKRATSNVMIERLKENIALLHGPLREALLSDCDPKEVISRIPAKARLVAVPLMRRACRGCLLNF